jgi:hypothetical protein
VVELCSVSSPFSCFRLCSLSCIWFLVQSSATLVTLLRFPI